MASHLHDFFHFIWLKLSLLVSRAKWYSVYRFRDAFIRTFDSLLRIICWSSGVDFMYSTSSLSLKWACSWYCCNIDDISLSSRTFIFEYVYSVLQCLLKHHDVYAFSKGGVTRAPIYFSVPILMITLSFRYIKIKWASRKAFIKLYFRTNGVATDGMGINFRNIRALIIYALRKPTDGPNDEITLFSFRQNLSYEKYADLTDDSDEAAAAYFFIGSIYFCIDVTTIGTPPILVTDRGAYFQIMYSHSVD